MRYLITGATGNVGSKVTHRLLERGERPRLFVRDAEKARAQYGDRVDIAVGNLADPSSLTAALVGMDALLLINSGPDLAARDAAAAKAAKAVGVGHLVKLSSIDAQQGVGTGAWHALGEAAIRATGIVFTFVQPGGFMSNALGWAASIRARGVVRSPTDDGKIAFIHPDDIAAVATQALTTQLFDGQSLAITGPAALSYAEMTEKIGAAIGKPLRFEPISHEEESRLMSESGDPPEVVAAHASIYRAIREGRLATVTDGVERVLGRRPMPFEAWAKDNADAFR